MLLEGERGGAMSRTPSPKGVENEWFWRNATSCSSDYEVHNKSKRENFVARFESDFHGKCHAEFLKERET